MVNMVARFGAWIALCLSRGPSSPLGENDIALLVEEMGEKTIAWDMFVFRRGDPTAMVHVVRSGTVELSREIRGRRVMLQVLRAGDVFGDVPAFLGEPEAYDARAVVDSTVLSLDAAALFDLLQTRPLIARRWFVSLAERMAGLQNRLIDLLAGGVERSWPRPCSERPTTAVGWRQPRGAWPRCSACSDRARSGFSRISRRLDSSNSTIAASISLTGEVSCRCSRSPTRTRHHGAAWSAESLFVFLLAISNGDWPGRAWAKHRCDRRHQSRPVVARPRRMRDPGQWQDARGRVGA